MAKDKGRANDVKVGNEQKRTSSVKATFPAPDAEERLRVNFSRRSYADLVAHAKESLDTEVCGVLVGEVGEDGSGVFVDVRAAIKGGAAREARAQVTFTHETWNQVHAVIDRDYPDLQIVGWYHTHPSFGVEFSAMDRFIQENFFPGASQIALVTDPLSGDSALLCNTSGGLEYLTKFWVDGREHKAKLPASQQTGPSSAAGDPGLRQEFRDLEQRVQRLLVAVEEQRVNFHRAITTILVVACTAIVTWVGYTIWSDRYERLEPPRVQSYVPVPIKIGDETVFVGVGVVEWKVPPRLDAMMDKLAKMEVEEQKRQQLERQKQLEKQKKAKPGPSK